jgi:hypothetical protein
MAYRLRVIANIDWVGPGQGPMDTLTAPMLPGGGSGAQTFNMRSTAPGYVIAGTGTGGALASADITALTNAAAADLAAQLNATTIPQGWISGQP